MSKKAVMELTGDKNRKGIVAIFYCKLQGYQFSLPEYETNPDGSFKKDATGNSMPIVVRDPNSNVTRTPRRVFQFKQQVQFNKETGKPDMMNFACKFEVREDDPYKDELMKFLTAKSKDAASSIYCEEEWVKEQNPQAYEQAEKVATLEDRIKELQSKVDAYEKGKK